MTTFARWLKSYWAAQEDHEKLLESYRVVFLGPHGERVFRHWMDNIYCQIYEGTDQMMLAYHNGRRSVIHEILQALDMANNPDKYKVEEDNG